MIPFVKLVDTTVGLVVLNADYIVRLVPNGPPSSCSTSVYVWDGTAYTIPMTVEQIESISWEAQKDERC